MIKVELLTEKPIALQVQEAVHMAVSMSPLAGTIKGREPFRRLLAIMAHGCAGMTFPVSGWTPA